jgi:hypothetical protein
MCASHDAGLLLFIEIIVSTFQKKKGGAALVDHFYACPRYPLSKTSCRLHCNPTTTRKVDFWEVPHDITLQVSENFSVAG